MSTGIMKGSIGVPSKRLIQVLDTLPYGIIILDREGRLELCNQKALQDLGFNNEAWRGQPIGKLLGSVPMLLDLLKIGREAKSFDLNSIPFNDKYLSFRGRPLSEGILLAIEDTTQIKESERTNLNALFEKQEAERRRLAREIHDGVGPLLSTIMLHLDAVRSELSDLPEKTLKKIEIMAELIHEVANDIRSISHALMPGALLDLGLVATLENLCQKANESEKVQVNFYSSGISEQLSKKLTLGIYRITQELLNNAFKYARARTINVQLIRHPNSILLTVEDDGVGFEKSDLSRLVNNGIGLRNIQSRSRALGGRFNIDSKKGRGVFATVEIPLK